MIRRFSIHGDDEHFARTIGITFETCMEYFGPSSISKRIEQPTLFSRLSYSPLPSAALDTRRVLTCHLLSGPILLLLGGPQGSGKTISVNSLFVTTGTTEGVQRFVNCIVSMSFPFRNTTIHHHCTAILNEMIFE